MSVIRSHIMVCCGTGCTSSESPKIAAAFEEQLAAAGLSEAVSYTHLTLPTICSV